jgi:hypothetical protein
MDLINILEKYKATNGNTKTHTIIPNKNNDEYKFGATYSIPLNKYQETCNLLYEYFFLNNGKLSITEAIPEICPLYIDIDLEFNTNSSERQYTDETIELLVIFINKMINEYFEIQDDVTCYIQEKGTPKLNETGHVIKEGLHLLYPNIIGHYKVFNEFIRLLSVCDIYYIFKTCKSFPINSNDKIFDTQVKRWFVYGASKPNGIPYKVTTLYINNSKVSVNKSDKKLLELFYLTKQFEKNINYLKNIDNILNMSEEFLKPSKSSLGLNILDDEYELDSDLDEEETQLSIELNEEMQQDKRNVIKRIVLECISTGRAKEYQ